MIQKRIFSLTLAQILLASGVLVLTGQTPAYAGTKTFEVNRVGDAADLDTAGSACDTSGKAGVQCTLRAAIMEANATPGSDLIIFKIPGAGRHTITPESDLPAITESVTINGYTEPGASPNTRKKGTNAKLMIAIDGENAGPDATGLLLDNVNGAVIRGLVIKDFRVGGGAGGHGIRLSGTSSGNRIQGNFIGTNFAGTASEGNSMGVWVGGSENMVGGTSRAVRNLISGNTAHGVLVASVGGTAEDNDVRGNLIGLAKNASADVGNADHGVFILFSSGNRVAANSIAFNGGDGVSTEGLSHSRNHVMGNSIYFNVGMGIDLGNDGRTLNDVDNPGDADDTDTGANNKQNYPEILTASTDEDGITTVVGELSSTGNESPDTSNEFTVRLFSNPPDTAEGKKLIATLAITDSSHEPAMFIVSGPRVALGNTITATATDAQGSTSEFSDPRFVRRPGGAN